MCGSRVRARPSLPLVIVDAAGTDFAHGNADCEHLFGMVRSISNGRRYLNPLPL